MKSRLTSDFCPYNPGMKVLRYFSFPLLASLAVAGPVTVRCNSAAGSSATYTTSPDGLSASCTGLVPGSGLQGGNASASLSITLGADGWYDLKTTSQTLVSPGNETAPGGTIPIGYGSAQTHIHWSRTYNSGGPVRPGYMYLVLNAYPARSYNAWETIVAGFADGTATSPASLLNGCRGDGQQVPGRFCNPGPGYFQAFGGYPVPITLGADMMLQVDADFSDYADGYSNGTGGVGSSSYRFRCTESDGTPVTLTATPEPSLVSMRSPAPRILAIVMNGNRRPH